MDCMLPEVIDPRIPRGLRIRDPAEITDAWFSIKKEKMKLSNVMKVNTFIVIRIFQTNSNQINL